MTDETQHAVPMAFVLEQFALIELERRWLQRRLDALAPNVDQDAPAEDQDA